MTVNPKPCLCFHSCAAIMRVERCFYPFWRDWVMLGGSWRLKTRTVTGGVMIILEIHSPLLEAYG